MEANPGEDWAPQQEPRERSGRTAHGDIRSWEHCFNENCNEHRCEKLDAGYYPRQVGEKETLSTHARREHKKRRAVRTQLGSEGSDKLFEMCNHRNGQSPPFEANSIVRPISLLQRTTTSNGSKGEGKTPTSIQLSRTEDAPNWSPTLERRSLVLWE